MRDETELDLPAATPKGARISGEGDQRKGACRTAQNLRQPSRPGNRAIVDLCNSFLSSDTETNRQAKRDVVSDGYLNYPPMRARPTGTA